MANYQECDGCKKRTDINISFAALQRMQILMGNVGITYDVCSAECAQIVLTDLGANWRGKYEAWIQQLKAAGYSERGIKE